MDVTIKGRLLLVLPKEFLLQTPFTSVGGVIQNSESHLSGSIPSPELQGPQGQSVLLYSQRVTEHLECSGPSQTEAG